MICSTAEASGEGAPSQQLAQLRGGRPSQQPQSPSLLQAVQSLRRTASTGRQAPEADAGPGRQALPAGGDVAILIDSSGDSRKTARFRLSLTSMHALWPCAVPYHFAHSQCLLPLGIHPEDSTLSPVLHTCASF